MEMAGAAGLEPVTSAVTGQRSNQLSYAPAMGDEDNKKLMAQRQGLVGGFYEWKIRAADAKEVGVGNPAEETCCYPNTAMLQFGNALSIHLSLKSVAAPRRARRGAIFPFHGC